MTNNYELVIVPDPVLKTMAQPVTRVDAGLRAQMDRMLQTMYDAPGIGLAANQVGLLNRVIVLDTAFRKGESDRNPICMVNPEIVWRSEEMSTMEEGCLSIPGQFAEVQRPLSVRVTYLDYHGKHQEFLANDLDSHCVQHEVDHLNGVLFIDYLSKLKRDMILRKLKKQQAEIM